MTTETCHATRLSLICAGRREPSSGQIASDADKGTSVISIGNPGVGKTVLAKIIGWRACQANKRVRFSTAADMLNHLNAS